MQKKAYCVIHLIEIYSVDSVMHLWNNETKCLKRLLLAKGSFSNDKGDGNKNVIRAVGLLDTKTNKFARASYFLVQFFAVTAWLRRESALFHVFWST